MVTWWTRRRQARRRRREIGLALRAEFELERPRGLAAVRAVVRGVGELERARMTARPGPADGSPRPAEAPQRTTTWR